MIRKPRKLTDAEMLELTRRAYEAPAIMRNAPAKWTRIKDRVAVRLMARKPAPAGSRVGGER